MSRWGILTPLTRRGSALLWCGVGIATVAFLFGQRDLIRVGVFLIALPALSLFVMSRIRFKVSITRGVSQSRIPVNGSTETSLRLHNVARISSGLLLLEDAIPWELGRSQRVVVDRLQPNQWRDVSCTVYGTARGRYTVGPTSITLVDPFGLCRTTRNFSATDTVTVVPATIALPTTPLHGDWAGVGESRARAIASTGDDDVIPREYRIGDDLRRVHWKSTARSGELMVRREEQPWRNRVTLVIDCREDAHRGSGPDSSFEWTVTAAASVGQHLLERGFGVRIMDTFGTPFVSPGQASESLSGSESVGALLDLMATVECGHAGTAPTNHSLSPEAFSDGVLIALLGDLELKDAEAIAALRPRRGTALAFILDTSSWGGRSQIPDHAGQSRSAALFAVHGWRSAICGRDSDLADTWRSLSMGALAGAS
jgi:uncharacterized protein (DUF58 family)